LINFLVAGMNINLGELGINVLGIRVMVRRLGLRDYL
jgi:hypothetical protein